MVHGGRDHSTDAREPAPGLAAGQAVVCHWQEAAVISPGPPPTLKDPAAPQACICRGRREPGSGSTSTTQEWVVLPMHARVRALVLGFEQGRRCRQMHPNELLARQEIELIQAGDWDALDGLYTDDIVIHYPGRNPLAGTHSSSSSSPGSRRS